MNGSKEEVTVYKGETDRVQRETDGQTQRWTDTDSGAEPQSQTQAGGARGCRQGAVGSESGFWEEGKGRKRSTWARSGA